MFGVKWCEMVPFCSSLRYVSLSHIDCRKRNTWPNVRSSCRKPRFEKPSGIKHRRKIKLVCDFRQEFVEYWTDNIYELCGISFKWSIPLRKRGMFCYPILTLVKREPSNHLPTNIFDILLGIWYLWLLYRTIHLGLLLDRTTFTPCAVPTSLLGPFPRQSRGTPTNRRLR